MCQAMSYVVVSMNKKALSIASNNLVTRWESEILKHSWFIVVMQNYLSITTKIFTYVDLFSSRNDLKGSNSKEKKMYKQLYCHSVYGDKVLPIT